MPKVLNKRNMAPSDWDNAIYVGRPTMFGNPHPIGMCHICRKEHDRAEAVACYEAGLTDALKSEAKQQLEGSDLVCWCAPEACHADVLLRIANES